MKHVSLDFFKKILLNKYVVTVGIILLLYIYFGNSLSYLFLTTKSKLIFLLIPFLSAIFITKFFKIKNGYLYSIILVGILIRFIYVNVVPYYERQYDVLNKNCGPAHLDYAYILSEFELPDTNEWQTYHPPLNAIIQGSWIRATAFVNNTEFSLEGLQMFSMIYGIFILYIVYDFLMLFKVKNIFSTFILLVTCFHPTLIYMSGGLNNDGLFTMLSIASLVLFMKYIKTQSIKDLVYLTVCTAFCIMTKNTALLNVLLVIFYFIYSMIKSKKIKNDLYHLLFFILVVVFFGCWYQIRNYILFGQTFTYVSFFHWEDMYLGNYSLLDRISITTLSNTFERFNSIVTIDYNIPLYLLRNSISGLWGISNNISSWILYISNILLILISIITFIYCLFRIKKNSIYVNHMLLFYLMLVGSYLLFALTFQYGCGMEFRYIASSFLINSLLIICAIDNIQKKALKKILCCIYLILLIIFSLSSIFTIISL